MTNTDFTARCMAGKALDDVARKQDTLTTEQLAAVNSGVTSADVEQITLNKNNILMLNQYGGGKNKFQTPVIDTTSSGINVKTLPDGQLKITSAGTNTSEVYINLELSVGSKYVGYKLSGGSANVGVYISNSGGGAACAVRGNEVSIPSNATNRLFLTINANTPAFEETIYVMIREFGDSTYQPYALSNAELTGEISPTQFTVPTIPAGAHATLESGGYTVTGNIVIVNMRLRFSQAITSSFTICESLPIPLADSSLATNSSIAPVNNNKGLPLALNTAGAIIMPTGATMPAEMVLISCVYVKA